MTDEALLLPDAAAWRAWLDEHEDAPAPTLSTTDLYQVERFAILVSSDAAGSAILEASPPAR